jgi:TonB-dependent receptor
MVDLALAERLRLVGGARLERSEVAVDAEPTIGARVHTAPAYTDLLPALALNFKLTEGQNFRLSVSQTLSRPEYRELAEIQYREVIGGENVIGNPALRRALIRNADLRWEWYPGAGEILSVALFAKRFQDPIERIYLATSGTRIVTFVNAEGAENYGVEFELRKSLGTLAEALAPLTLAANATLMHSEIRIGSGMASKTNDRRAMVGQAPYVFNTSLTYASAAERASATLLYNVVGRRIVSASEAPLPDVVEEPRHALDLALRFPLMGGVSAKIDARNLLDSPAEVRQGGVVREFYRTGRSVSFGVSVRP